MGGDVLATEILDRLRHGGSRVTKSRRAIVSALVNAPDHHLTAADIVAVVRADDPEFYESTVYRTLDRLLELGVVERVQLGGAGAVFHLPATPHHHLVCQRCGKVLEIAPDLLDDLAERVLAEHGFRLRPGASTLVGLCRQCDSGDVS